MNMSYHWFMLITKWIISLITLVAFFLFLRSFVKMKEKTAGFIMIFILNIFCLIFPIMDLLKILIIRSEACGQDRFGCPRTTDLIASLEVTNDQFSLYWTAVLALFTYWSLQLKISNAKRFIVYAFLASALACSLMPICIHCNFIGVDAYYDELMVLRLENSDEIADLVAFFIVYNFTGKIVPVVIISFCYIKVYHILKDPMYYKQGGIKGRRSRVLWHGIIPIICFVPGIITDMVISIVIDEASIDYTNDNAGIWIYALQELPNRLWGLLNLLNFWFLRPTHGDEAEEDEDDLYLSAVDESLLYKR